MKISRRTFRILAAVWGLVWAVLIVGTIVNKARKRLKQ